MSLFYLYRFKFAVKLQIILFENAIIGHFATRAVSGQFQGSFGLVVGKSTRPSIFSLPHPYACDSIGQPSVFAKTKYIFAREDFSKTTYIYTRGNIMIHTSHDI